MRDDWPPVMKITEVAEYLQISRSQAYELVHVPTFPAFAISPRRYRVLKTSLDAWLRELPVVVPGEDPGPAASPADKEEA